MLKISDILKKNRKISKKKSVNSEGKVSFEKNHDEDIGFKHTTHNKKEEKQILTDNIRKEVPAIVSPKVVYIKNADNHEAVDLYKEVIAFTEGIDGLSFKDWKNFKDRSDELVDKIVAILKSDETTLLNLFFGEYYSFKGYLSQHSVNVCILCLDIALSLKYGREQLQQIGLSALLHDIGLIQFDHLISQNKRFNTDDYNEVKKHPISGKQILETISSNLSNDVLDAVLQEHERLDGSGYPNALTEKEISDKAKLLGLVDSYESMMHARPYRDKFKSEDVIKFFTKQKAKFEYKFIKALIDLVGVFPVTTRVKLNTREIGIVIKQNYQMPFKPVVNITHNAQGQEVDSPKAIDLASNFSIYILECFISHKTKNEKNSE